MNTDSENEPFNLAAEVVNFTNRNLFLTGKAGTGKTTFLKYIREQSSKNTVVVAPTGVAAINAGGVTMHSFFQLPFIPYVPQETRIFNHTATVDRHALIKNIRFGKEKLDIIHGLDLLIIDEVSMLRADMLDAMDEILRHFRHKRNLPFGGVQVLFIGDLFQLPPVVSDNEWPLLKDYYESPFFFSAKVIKDNPPVFIELKKIYRQKEEQFIHLLNQIRNNNMSEIDFELLNQRYRSNNSEGAENGITLTTHNYMADKINQSELQKLGGKLHQFSGEIKGDFSEKSLPTEMQLSLKEGAQIMFLKNDSDPSKRYYNGKLATVKSLSSDKITVVLADSEVEMDLEKEKWSNIKYGFNKETNSIEEEELGSFTQFPVRLAWAITIHKSQGLTFDKVVIDAGSSFAAGQVYVALSRCRTLDGIILLSKIFPKSLHHDERIVQFSARENKEDEVYQLLEKEKPLFAAQLLIRTFDWSKLVVEVHRFDELTAEKKIPEKEVVKATTFGLTEIIKKQQDFADRFVVQLNQLLQESTVNGELLNERVVKAKSFFIQSLQTEILKPLQNIQLLLKGKKQIKQYLRAITELEDVIWGKLHLIQSVTLGDFKFEVPGLEKRVKKTTEKNAKVVKGESKAVTLEMYKQGMNAQEIATQRGYAITTIEGHLAEFVGTGEVNVYDFVSDEWIEKIKVVMEKLDDTSLTSLKQALGEDISYGQLRVGLNFIKSISEKPVNA